ncbi:MAG: efflux RND transporter periplasmic adaptor subunit [Spirochaetota bacterium]|nr:efflux RND transporter periplasmic adaptor subunit [Spirochaetota bacterium]
MQKRWGMKYRRIGMAVLLGAAVIFLIVGVTGCSRGGNRGNSGEAGAASGSASAGEAQGPAGPGGTAEESEPVFAVSTIKAVEGQIRDYLELNGDVTASRKVDTYPDTAGKLSKIYVEVGQRVRKDQVIAEVDPSRPGMQFTASPVKAAISGTVTSIPVQVGSTVSQQVPIAQISDMSDLEVRVYVAEKFVSKMKVGLPVEMFFEAFPDRTFRGKIRELSPVIDPLSRTLEVKISIGNDTDLLKAGMFGEVKIITEEKEGVVKIPADCLVQRFGEDFIFIVERSGGDEMGIARRRKVVTGIQIDQKLEIMEGLRPGAEVVYRGQTLLEEGSKVRVVEEAPPLAGDDTLE